MGKIGIWIRFNPSFWLVLFLLSTFFIADVAKAVVLPTGQDWRVGNCDNSPAYGSRTVALSALYCGAGAYVTQSTNNTSRCPNSNINSYTALDSGGGYCGLIWNRGMGTCPANSTIASTGTSCTCNSGYTESNGQCVLAYVNPCLALVGSAVDVFSTSASGTRCIGGCAHNMALNIPGQTVLRHVAGTPYELSSYRATATSQECTLSPDAPPVFSTIPESTCSENQGSITYGGVKVCLDQQTETTTEETKTTDPSGVETTVSTTSDGKGGTITTTTVYNPATGQKTVTSTNVAGTQAVYCQSHPEDPQCLAGKGLGEAPEFDSNLPEATPLPARRDLPGLEVSYTRLGGITGACPAPIEFTAMGQDFEIDLAPVCDYAGMIRALFLLMSAFVGFRILAS